MVCARQGRIQPAIHSIHCSGLSVSPRSWCLCGPGRCVVVTLQLPRLIMPLLTLVQGEDNSPASFEKTLSTLSTKIAQTTSRLDQQRQTTRRFKALWTLYSTLAYLFYSIVLALVLGWESWGLKEYAAIGGGPVLYELLSFRIFVNDCF